MLGNPKLRDILQKCQVLKDKETEKLSQFEGD